MVRLPSSPRSVESDQGLIRTQAGKGDIYAPLVTQIFDKTTKYLDNDSVFAVKDDLVVDFVPVKDHPKASLELEYNIRLAAQKA